MAHDIEAVMLFNIMEATYLLSSLDAPTSTKPLIVHHSQQLLKCPVDLHDMADWVLKAHKLSATQFITHLASTIINYDFLVGSLVLVWNSQC